MERNLTLEDSISILRRHQRQKKWAESVGDALAGKDLKRLKSQHAKWRLSGKKGSMDDFLLDVSRTHKKASEEINGILREAERRRGTQRPKRGRMPRKRL